MFDGLEGKIEAIEKQTRCGTSGLLLTIWVPKHRHMLPSEATEQQANERLRKHSCLHIGKCTINQE